MPEGAEVGDKVFGQARDADPHAVDEDLGGLEDVARLHDVLRTGCAALRRRRAAGTSRASAPSSLTVCMSTCGECPTVTYAISARFLTRPHAPPALSTTNSGAVPHARAPPAHLPASRPGTPCPSASCAIAGEAPAAARTSARRPHAPARPRPTLPSRPMGVLERRKCDSVDENTCRCNTCVQTQRARQGVPNTRTCDTPVLLCAWPRFGVPQLPVAASATLSGVGHASTRAPHRAQIGGHP